MAFGGHLLDERDQFAERSTLEGHRHHLRAEQGGGVRLATVVADLERFVGQLLGAGRVSGQLGPRGTHDQVPPIERRLVELCGQFPKDLQAAVHLVDIASSRNRRPRVALARCPECL